MKKTFKKWLIPVIAAVVAIVAVVVLFATGVIGSGNIKVPDLLNMNIEEAQKVLEEKGLLIDVIKEINDDVDENIVFKQNPPMGGKVKKGTVITVVISEKPMETIIPDVEYYDKNTAIDVLENAGLYVEIIEEENDKYADGAVISQSQTGKGQTGSVITITVSKNDTETKSETIKVPSLAGKTLAEAKEILGDKLYIKIVAEDFSDTIKKGAIISQNPEADKDVNLNTVVSVAISKGKASETEIIMPDVVFSPRVKARETLEKLGLKVVVKEEYSSTVPAGVVVSQSIPKGEKITADKVITIVVSNGVKPEITTLSPEDIPTYITTSPGDETTKENQPENPTKKPSTTTVPTTENKQPVADKEEAKYVADFAIVTDKTEAKAGDIITVSVKLKTNYKIVAISLPVIYDSNAFEIVGAEEARPSSYLNFTGTLTENGYTTNGNWKSPESMYSKNSNEDYWTSAIAKAKYKIAFATWVAAPSQGTVISTLDKEETIVTFRLKVKENVSDTSGKIFLSQDFIKTASAPQGILSVGRTKSDTITTDSIVSTGQTIDIKDAVALVTIK